MYARKRTTLSAPIDKRGVALCSTQGVYENRMEDMAIPVVYRAILFHYLGTETSEILLVAISLTVNYKAILNSKRNRIGYILCAR